MKKKTLIFIFLFFSLTHIEAKKIQGYFISNTHDTVRVIFNIPIKLLMQEPNFESLQKKVKYFDSNNLKHFLKPDMVIEIAFDFEGKKYRMLSRNDDLGLNGIFSNSNKIFLHFIKDGKLKLFEYHFSSGGGGGMMMGAGGTMTMTPGGGSHSSSKYILQKENAQLFETKSGWWLSFREDMTSYFSDCPEVVKKIKEKVYKRDDIELIVDEYNRNCR